MLCGAKEGEVLVSGERGEASCGLVGAPANKYFPLRPAPWMGAVMCGRA